MLNLIAVFLLVTSLTVTTGCVKKKTEPEVVSDDQGVIELEIGEPGDTNGDEIPTITQEELDRGYYYGTQDQMKPGTPDNWFYVEAGRNSMWKEPK